MIQTSLSTGLKRNRISESRKGHHIFLSIHSIVVLLPFLWLFISTFKTDQELVAHPYGLPEMFRLNNYSSAWKSISMLVLFKNSIFLCVVSVACTLLLTALASYALSRFKLKINKYLYNFFLVGMMIPINAAIIPLFITMKDLGLVNTYPGVIIPYIGFGIPMGIFLMSSYMKGIPNEIEEAAIIDGCGLWGLFAHVILPLSRPIFATCAIISFMGLWNDFLFALVFLSGKEHQTVPLGLATFRGQYSTNHTTMMAGVVIAMIPTIIIYIMLRDNIMKGMTAGSVKG